MLILWLGQHFKGPLWFFLTLPLKRIYMLEYSYTCVPSGSLQHIFHNTLTLGNCLCSEAIMDLWAALSASVWKSFFPFTTTPSSPFFIISRMIWPALCEIDTDAATRRRIRGASDVILELNEKKMLYCIILVPTVLVKPLEPTFAFTTQRAF